MDTKQLFTVISSENGISVPIIQDALKCGYLKAKEEFSLCVENGWIAVDDSGNVSDINHKTLQRKALSNGDCKEIAMQLTDDEIQWLERISESLYDGCQGFDASGKLKKEAEHLMTLQVLHSFRDKYFLSIDKSTFATIKTFFMEQPDDTPIADISYSVAMACIKEPVHGVELLSLEFVPLKCKKYIKRNIEKYRSEKAALRQPRSKKELSKFLFRFKLEIIAAFLSVCDFPTKEEYIKKAEENLSVVMNSEFCSELFKQASTDTVNQIRDDMTITDIREIRRALVDDDD